MGYHFRLNHAPIKIDKNELVKLPLTSIGAGSCSENKNNRTAYGQK